MENKPFFGKVKIASVQFLFYGCYFQLEVRHDFFFTFSEDEKKIDFVLAIIYDI